MKCLSKIIMVALLASLTACTGSDRQSSDRNGETDNMKQASLYDNDGKQLFKISGDSAVSQIELILETRKPMMKKILPIFDSKLTISVGSEKEEWLFVKPNYIKRNSKKDRTIYVFDRKYDLYNTLQNLSQF